MSGLSKHLLCPMQCHLNGVPISEVPSSWLIAQVTHAIIVIDPLDVAHLLITTLQLYGVTSYFNVHSSNIAEYENEEIPEIHLTEDELPWDPSTNENSERVTQMTDHQGHIIVSAMMAKGPVFINTIIL